MNILSNKFQCDLCSSNKCKEKKSLNYRLGIESTKHNVVKCVNCGLLSLCPIPDDCDFSLVYDGYARKRNRIEVERNRMDAYQQKLKKLQHFTKGRKILDIGAGLGTFMFCAKKCGFDAIGVEYETEQCKMAKELYGIDLINDKLEVVFDDLLSENFDIIHMHHVLEHVQSPQKILKMIHKLLNPGGILLVEVPNQFCNIKRELRYLLLRKFEYPDNSLHHLYFYSVQTLEKYMQLCNFRLLEFNQYRPKDANINIFLRSHKILYRHITTKLKVGSGSFIEFYLKKENNIKKEYEELQEGEYNKEKNLHRF